MVATSSLLKKEYSVDFYKFVLIEPHTLDSGYDYNNFVIFFFFFSVWIFIFCEMLKIAKRLNVRRQGCCTMQESMNPMDLWEKIRKMRRARHDLINIPTIYERVFFTFHRSVIGHTYNNNNIVHNIRLKQKKKNERKLEKERNKNSPRSS